MHIYTSSSGSQGFGTAGYMTGYYQKEASFRQLLVTMNQIPVSRLCYPSKPSNYSSPSCCDYL